MLALLAIEGLAVLQIVLGLFGLGGSWWTMIVSMESLMVPCLSKHMEFALESVEPILNLTMLCLAEDLMGLSKSMDGPQSETLRMSGARVGSSLF